jgi:hypothetical protein
MNGSRCFTHSWSSPFQPSVPAHILVFGYTGFQTCKNHSCTSQANKNNSCSALIKVFHITGITININIQFTSHCPAMKWLWTYIINSITWIKKEQHNLAWLIINKHQQQKYN